MPDDDKAEAKKGSDDKGDGDGDDGDAPKPKFCSCEKGSGLRTKVCCMFCCGDMFEAQSPGGDADEDDEDAGNCCAPKTWPENPNAPWQKGKCKDIYCIVLFLIFWLGAFVVAYIGFTMGSWRRVIYATDFDGQTCGTGPDSATKNPTCPRGLECEEDLTKKVNVVWPRLGADVLISMAMGFDTTDIQGSIKNLKLYGICVDTCPQVGDYVCNYEGERKHLLAALKHAPTLTEAFGVGTDLATSSDYTQKQRARTVNECYKIMWDSPAGQAGVTAVPGMSVLSAAMLPPECLAVTENCWINPIETKKVMFRCIPKFWAITGSGKECLMPAKMGSTTPPGCLDLPENCVATNNANKADGTACDPCVDDREIMAAGNPGCITVKKTDTAKVDMPKGSEVIFDIMSGIAGTMMKMAGDLMNSAYVVIICGLILSLALSWGWIIFLQYFVGLIVWTTVAIFYISWFLGTCFLYVKGGIATVDNVKKTASWISRILAERTPIDTGLHKKLATVNVTEPPLPSWMTPSGPYTEYFGYAAYGMTAGFIVVVIAGIALYKKVKVAIAILREAAKALQAMPTLIFFPLWSLVQALLVAIWWLIVQLFIMSAGKLSVGELTANMPNASSLPPGAAAAAGKTAEYKEEDASKYLMVYHLFVTFWTLNTIEGVGLTVIATSVCAWYFTKEIDWKNASFEEEKMFIDQMHDKPCWSTHKPCCPKLPVDHWAQPCTAQRCFFRLFGLKKCCFVFPSCKATRRTCEEKREEARRLAAEEDSDESSDEEEGSDNADTTNPMKVAAKGAAEASGEEEESGEEGEDEEEKEKPLSDPEQRLCAENHGCPRALCCDCKPADGSNPCKVRQFFCKLNKGIDYDGDGEIDCAERMDCRPAPGCFIYTLTCCCLCQFCCYCCMNPIEKDKCWKKGGLRYTVDYLRDEACPRNSRPDIEVCICLKGWCRAATFHLGPVLIGSFMIAIIQTARVVMVYVEQQVKQAMGKKKSKIVEKIFAILQGIMWVFEQCMKFITRNTYIMVAMKDLGFARACASAVGLLISNVFVLGMVKIFATVVIILGKIIVVLSSAGICMAWLQVDPMFSFSGPLPLHGTLFQTVVVAVLAFMVAEIFFYTFQMTIDTVLLCFCEDCYQNDGIPEHNAAIKRTIEGNAAKAPVAGSVIFKNAAGEFEEFDMLLKVDKWTLKDMKKAIKGGNRMDAPGIPPIEEMELLLYDKKAATGFTELANGKLKKSKIHVIFKRHFPIFMRKKGDGFPEDQANAVAGGVAMNDAMAECLLKHGIKLKAPKVKKAKDSSAADAAEAEALVKEAFNKKTEMTPSEKRARTHGKVVEM